MSSRFARAVVVLDHSGSGDVRRQCRGWLWGDAASLAVVSLQNWADDAVHLSHHHAQLGKDASLTHTAVTLGAGSVVQAGARRCGTRGPGGDAELRGLYFADAGQHLEHRLFVDHAERNCRSPGELQGARCRARTRTRCGSET